MRETAANAGRTIVMWVVIAALVVGTIFLVNHLFYEPQRQRGFVSHVSGLLSTYCSTDRNDIRTATRTDLVGKRDGVPERWAQLESRLAMRLEAAINNDEGACP